MTINVKCARGGYDIFSREDERKKVTLSKRKREMALAKLRKQMLTD